MTHQEAMDRLHAAIERMRRANDEFRSRKSVPPSDAPPPPPPPTETDRDDP